MTEAQPRGACSSVGRDTLGKGSAAAWEGTQSWLPAPAAGQARVPLAPIIVALGMSPDGILG